MSIHIYGKDGCVNCEKSKLLCQMQSLDFHYHTVGADISVDELHAKVGTPVRSLPQIFIQGDATLTHIGGYEELRQHGNTCANSIELRWGEMPACVGVAVHVQRCFAAGLSYRIGNAPVPR